MLLLQWLPKRFNVTVEPKLPCVLVDAMYMLSKYKIHKSLFVHFNGCLLIIMRVKYSIKYIFTTSSSYCKCSKILNPGLNLRGTCTLIAVYSSSIPRVVEPSIVYEKAQ